MSDRQPNITLPVDLTNPGQFFACCGLLELADRLWPGAEGWFSEGDRAFRIVGVESLAVLIRTITDAKVTLLDAGDIYSGRVRIDLPSRPLVLDWWHEAGGRKDAK